MNITTNGLGNLNLSKSIFKSNLNAMSSIFKDSKKIREEKIKEIESQIGEWSKKYNSFDVAENQESIDDDTFNDYNHYSYHFEYYIMHSLFLSSFSFFDNHLKRIVELLQDEVQPRIKLNDIRGKGDVDTMRKYLFLVMGIESAKNNSNEWKDILEFKAIRNAIVHKGNILNKGRNNNPSGLVGYRKLKEHDVWMNPEIVFFRIKKVEFLEDFEQVVIRFTENIIDEIHSKSIPVGR